MIATDKTGTLTENKMTLTQWATPDERRLFTYGSLMADVSYDSKGGFLGDPMDKAVVDKAEALGINRRDLLLEYHLVEDFGFDEGNKTFNSRYTYEGKTITLIKGAPESIFSLSQPDAAMEKQLKDYMSEGYRTIAVAFKVETETLFTLSGLICFDDPIREGVKEAVSDCKSAGVKVMMITGDHASTAKRVAENAGIEVTGVLTGDEITAMSAERLAKKVEECNVFARISPEQKLNIVHALHAKGEVVAVTGDGINDAPALKAADIGISMGISGTDVAKEAADMILTDDSFASIIVAIEEGRRLYDNLSKCVKYYLACKVGLIITFLVPVLFNTPMPFSPIQIIILELFMDLAASTSFVAEPAESDVLKRKPRDPNENFMNRQMITGILSGGLTLSVLVLLVYFYILNSTNDLTTAQTFAFVAWLFGHVSLALNMRTNDIPLKEVGVFSSKPFNIWIIGIVLFLVVALNVPVIREYLNLTKIGILPTIGLAIIALIAASWMEFWKLSRQ